jgi:hypothetical protein
VAETYPEQFVPYFAPLNTNSVKTCQNSVARDITVTVRSSHTSRLSSSFDPSPQRIKSYFIQIVPSPLKEKQMRVSRFPEIIRPISALLSGAHFPSDLSRLLQVYLIGHMPPGSDERQRGFPPAHSVYTDYHNKKYLELVRRYADIIVGQFFGHLHSDTFRVIYGERVPALALLVFEKRKSRKISGNPSVTVLQSCSRVALESCLEIRLECNLTPREN